MFKSLKKSLSLAVVAGTLSFAGAVAQAATFTFSLSDHGFGNMAATYDYGLRLDREAPPRFFSFENGASATLVYDDVAGTALISGTVREHLGRDINNNEVFGDLWNLNYALTNLIDLGGGAFEDRSGLAMGSVSLNGDVLSLGSAANNAGQYFIFADDGHRIPGDDSSFVGRGWVQKDPGANDFLFSASLVSMPLPAGAWLLLAGIGGLGAMKRRQRA